MAIEGLGEDPEGATPLTEEQREGLIASWVATRDDLNEAEADNIADARRKWRRKRLSLHGLLHHAAVRELHYDMYCDVWDWAGTYRTTAVNIGVEFWKIAEAVVNLSEDTKLWIAGTAPMSLDRAACRFHHRLVQIHPFPNGNGRHSRDMTDILLRLRGGRQLTWGRGDLKRPEEVRRAYIGALQAADRGMYDDLERFVRS